MARIVHAWAIKDCSRESSRCDGTSGAPKLAKRPILTSSWEAVTCPWCHRAKGNGVPARCHGFGCSCEARDAAGPAHLRLRLVKG